MLRPKRMSRVLVAGASSELRPAVEALQRAGSLHLRDYLEQHPGFKLGTPMGGASERSERLLKLRSASKALGLEDSPSGERRTAAWARERLDGLLAKLETEVASREARRVVLEGSIRELEKRREAVLPFTELPLSFDQLQPYENLAVFTGTVKTPPGPGLAAEAGRTELFQSRPGGLMALFVEKGRRERVEKYLSSLEFAELKVPERSGRPADVLGSIEAELGTLREELAGMERELSAVRDGLGGELLACSEELSVQIERDEAPLRFATTANSFVIDGWVPTDELERTENALILATGGRICLERLDEQEWLADAPGDGAPAGGAAADADGEDRAGPGETDPYDQVPVALSNPAPVKPFEALTEMFSLPSYREVDPTTLLALAFPLFFGLMVGDAGYGVLLLLTGLLFVRKLKHWEGFREMGIYIAAAGAVAIVLGLFVFGEAFGLPFHGAVHEDRLEEMSWHAVTGVDIPLRAPVHKLEGPGLGTLMVLSVCLGVVHLSLGNILGAWNEWGRSRRHALGKMGWLLAVLGFGLLVLKFGEGTDLGGWLWSGPLAPLSPSWDPGIGILFPWASLVLLLGGVALAAAGEGPLAFLEAMGVLSNILSYTRLAAIGIAKAAMALAFNLLLVPLVTGGQPVYILGGWIFLVLAHFLVFVLGGLSSGIQALRLNLVEFFMKFYRGGGVKFEPFGRSRRHTVEA